jgi:hypothetical protein
MASIDAQTTQLTTEPSTQLTTQLTTEPSTTQSGDLIENIIPKYFNQLTSTLTNYMNSPTPEESDAQKTLEMQAIQSEQSMQAIQAMQAEQTIQAMPAMPAMPEMPAIQDSQIMQQMQQMTQDTSLDTIQQELDIKQEIQAMYAKQEMEEMYAKQKLEESQIMQAMQAMQAQAEQELQLQSLQSLQSEQSLQSSQSEQSEQSLQSEQEHQMQFNLQNNTINNVGYSRDDIQNYRDNMFDFIENINLTSSNVGTDSVDKLNQLQTSNNNEINGFNNKTIGEVYDGLTKNNSNTRNTCVNTNCIIPANQDKLSKIESYLKDTDKGKYFRHGTMYENDGVQTGGKFYENIEGYDFKFEDNMYYN